MEKKNLQELMSILSYDFKILSYGNSSHSLDICV